jgi:hypothetical protein
MIYRDLTISSKDYILDLSLQIGVSDNKEVEGLLYSK